MKCEYCQANIRGDYDVEGILYISHYIPPSYCHNCGHAYPWTETKIKMASEIIDELDELTPLER